MTTLTALREARGLTLEEVQRATGVHISTLSRIERGQLPRNAERAEKLAAFYLLELSAFYAAVLEGGARSEAVHIESAKPQPRVEPVAEAPVASDLASDISRPTHFWEGDRRRDPQRADRAHGGGPLQREIDAIVCPASRPTRLRTDRPSDKRERRG